MVTTQVGFHTFDYARHFLSACKRLLDLDFEALPGGMMGVNCSGCEKRQLAPCVVHSELKCMYSSLLVYSTSGPLAVMHSALSAYIQLQSLLCTHMHAELHSDSSSLRIARILRVLSVTLIQGALCPS